MLNIKAGESTANLYDAWNGISTVEDTNIVSFVRIVIIVFLIVLSVAFALFMWFVDLLQWRFRRQKA